MPTIILTNMSPAELFKAAHDQAVRASREVLRLHQAMASVTSQESLDILCREVTYHAVALAEAFAVIDGLADEVMATGISPTTSAPSGHRGVSPDEVN